MTRTRLARWVLLVTLGEAVGFAVPTAVGVAVSGADWSAWPSFVVIVLAGAVEGAALGAAQADCLYRWGVLPVRRWWIVATSSGALVAWSIGMIIFSDLRWSLLTAVSVVVGGLVLLASLPTAQYVVLRGRLRRPALWIPINMVAWLVGITWTLAPSVIVNEATPTQTLILIYGAAGLCMALTVASITGIGMLRLQQSFDPGLAEAT